MNDSITNELRELIEEHWPNSDSYWREDGKMFAPSLDAIADRIDERYDALKSDNSDLKAKLYASILPPVDIDGKTWTCEDVDKPFSLTDGDNATVGGLVREIAYGWPRKGWFIVDQYDTHYPADKCRHVSKEPSEPTDSQESIDADAEAGPCKYFGHSCVPCCGCPAQDSPKPCHIMQTIDLLRRQRELDVISERAAVSARGHEKFSMGYYPNSSLKCLR